MWTLENMNMHLVKVAKYVTERIKTPLIDQDVYVYYTLTLCYGCDRRYEESY